MSCFSFEIVAEHGALVVSAINKMSDHYRPAEASLAVPRQAFEYEHEACLHDREAETIRRGLPV